MVIRLARFFAFICFVFALTIPALGASVAQTTTNSTPYLPNTWVTCGILLLAAVGFAIWAYRKNYPKSSSSESDEDGVNDTSSGYPEYCESCHLGRPEGLRRGEYLVDPDPDRPRRDSTQFELGDMAMFSGPTVVHDEDREGDESDLSDASSSAAQSTTDKSEDFEGGEGGDSGGAGASGSFDDAQPSDDSGSGPGSSGGGSADDDSSSGDSPSDDSSPADTSDSSSDS